MSKAHATATGPPKSNGRRERAAEQGNDQRLGEVIAHQAPAARAHRRPDRQVPLTDRAADEHHARDVQSDDEQHDRGEAEDASSARVVICERRRAPAGKYGSTPPALSWFVEGYRAASAAIADCTAASACGTVVPGCEPRDDADPVRVALETRRSLRQ